MIVFALPVFVLYVYWIVTFVFSYSADNPSHTPKSLVGIFSDNSSSGIHFPVQLHAGSCLSAPGSCANASSYAFCHVSPYSNITGTDAHATSPFTSVYLASTLTTPLPSYIAVPLIHVPTATSSIMESPRSPMSPLYSQPTKSRPSMCWILLPILSSSCL